MGEVEHANKKAKEMNSRAVWCWIRCSWRNLRVRKRGERRGEERVRGTIPGRGLCGSMPNKGRDTHAYLMNKGRVNKHGLVLQTHTLTHLMAWQLFFALCYCRETYSVVYNHDY